MAKPSPCLSTAPFYSILLSTHPTQAAHLIGLDPHERERPEFVRAMAGCEALPGTVPYAQCYGGEGEGEGRH